MYAHDLIKQGIDRDRGRKKVLRVRNATENDFDRIMEIYRYAREFMIRSGNPNQWGHDLSGRRFPQTGLSSERQ